MIMDATAVALLTTPRATATLAASALPGAPVTVHRAAQPHLRVPRARGAVATALRRLADVVAPSSAGLTARGHEPAPESHLRIAC